MITDLIVTWPRNCDYPLWRQFIRDNRPKFNEIIIGMHNSNIGHDFTNFIREAMHPDYVLIHDAPEPLPGEDWRDRAVNASLLHSYNAPWIWFTEQDFYPKEGFWEEVEKLESEGCDAIAVYQQTRLHPCCIFIKREMLNKTSKMFGIEPGQSDHFGTFQRELEALGAKIGKISEDKYLHYNGLSHNWRLASEGGEPNYQIDEFIDWLKQSVAVSVPQCSCFTDVANAVIAKHSGEKEQK